jgi:arginyl-tRNA synthetase
LRFLGHTVVTDNHLGDWGTQFGMLIYGWKHFLYPAALETDPVREMVRLYVRVRNEIGAAGDDAAEVAVNPVAEACRQETAKLHAGDPENVALWQKMMPWCQAELDKVYQRLDVQFDHTHGESFYNPMLPGVVEELLAKGIAEVSNGAVVVFHSRETDDRGNLKEPPSLIRKRDGAFTYTTSDLATIRYRMDHYHPDAALYVVDFRQALHFKQLFAIARKWGYANVELQHIQFGSVLGPDGKPIKTREGGAIELEQLLDEAIQRARKIVDQESPELTEAERAAVAEAVGIGAVKYADLSQNRTSDYVFSWDKMLAMNGNTGTYMQYAYARCCNIFRKGNERREAVRAEPPLPSLDTAAERGLGLMLLRFPEAVAEAAAAYHPHAITGYLWDLATALSAFYRDCQVLKAETAALRRSRLLLCDLTARVIQKGLHLLGIRTMERM